jgi:quercetin dioxygenase-like cupin family protein
VACVQVGDKEVELRAGSGVLVPRGNPHTYWNPGPGPTRYLLIMTSNIYQLIQGNSRDEAAHSGRSGSGILEA